MMNPGKWFDKSIQDFQGVKVMVLYKQKILAITALLAVLIMFSQYRQMEEVVLKATPHMRCCEGWIMVLLFVLMVLNVAFESFKLTPNVIKGKMVLEALKLVCSGYAMQWILPGILGTWTGRILPAEKEHWSNQTKVLLVGGFFQTGLNLAGGLTALFLLGRLLGGFALNGKFLGSLGCMLVMFVGTLFLTSRSRFSWHILPNAIVEVIDQWRSEINLKWLSWIIFWSGIRYCCYVVQFSLCMSQVSGLNAIDALLSSVLYFGMLSLVPLPGAWSALTRSAVAGMIFPAFGIAAIDAIGVALFIFLLNQGVPAIMGWYFLLKQEKTDPV